MITPSVPDNLNDIQPPMWSHCTLDEVKDMIRCDSAEIARLAQLQADAQWPDYRLRMQQTAWEQAQDVHMSWYKEIVNAGNPRSANRSESLGADAVGPSY